MMKPVIPMAKVNQYDAFVLPLVRTVMAEDMNGPMKDEVLPTVLNSAKKR